jgi:protein-disulfide isomerase
MTTINKPVKVNPATVQSAFTDHLSQNPALVSDAVTSYLDARPGVVAAAPQGEAIREYLLTNPGVIVEAINAYEAQQKAAEAAADGNLITTNAKEIFEDGFSIVRGNPEGDITMVEFADYNCGFCKRAHTEVEKFIEADGNIRLIIKEFPILGDMSVLAAKAALASAMQDDGDKYPAFNDALMVHRGSHTEASVMAIASEVGLDVDKLKADMETDTIKDQINRTYALAQKLRINGTPAFIMGDQVVRGFVPADRLKALADTAREEG